MGKGGHADVRRALISDNTADYGAGVGVFEGGSPTFSDSLLSDNKAVKWGGGAIVYQDARALFARVALQRNKAGRGGASSGWL